MSFYEEYKNRNKASNTSSNTSSNTTSSGSLYQQYLNYKNGISNIETPKSNKENYLSTLADSSKLSKYNSVMNNADFEENSQYKGGSFSLTNEEANLYKLINNSDKYIKRGRNDIVFTDDEKKLFNYYYNTGDTETASKLYQDLQEDSINRYDDYLTALESDNTKTVIGGIGKTLVTRPQNVIGGLEQALFGTANGIASLIQGESFSKGWNDVARNNVPVANSAAIETATANKISDKTEGLNDTAVGKAASVLGIDNIPSFAYQTGASIVDSMLSRAFSALLPNGVGEAVGLIALGGSAARQKTIDTLNNGGTELEAAASGMASGLIEGITEKIGTDKFFDMVTGTAKTSTQEIVKAISSAMLAEGSEEALSDVLNLITDTLILDLNKTGAKSEYTRIYNEYRKEYNEAEAKKKTVIDFLQNVSADFIGGALSGAVSGGMASALNYTNNKATGKQVNNAGNLQNVIDLANEEGRTDLAETLQKNPSDANVGFVENTILNNAVNAIGSEEARADEKVRNEAIKHAQDTAEKIYKNASPVSGITDKDGNALEIKNISWDNGLEIETDKGTFKESELNITDSAKRVIDASEDIPEEARKTFVENYQGENLGDYINEFSLIWEYGLNGLTDSIAKRYEKAKINKDAYINIARAATKSKRSRFEKVNRAEQKIKDIKSKYINSNVEVKIDDSAVDYANLTENQEINIAYAGVLADAFNVNVTFFDSSKETGELKKANGSYTASTNTIMLDINATNTGAKGDKTNAIITTMSHELTHFAKENAPELYDILRHDILTTLKTELSNELELKDNETLDIATYVEFMKDRYPNMSGEDVADELVARACENMLQNSHYAIRILENAEASERKGFVAKVKNLFEKLLNAFKEVILRCDSKSAEYYLLSKNVEELKKLQGEWDQAIKQAAENAKYRNAEIQQAEKSKNVKYSEKENIFEDMNLIKNSWKSEDGYIHLEADDMLSLDDFEKYMTQLIGRDKRIETHLRKINQMIKDNVVINKSKLNEFARRIKTSYGLTINLKNLSERLAPVFMKVTDVDTFNKAANKIALELVKETGNKSIDEGLKAEAERLKKELKSYKFSLNEGQKQELKYKYGSNWSSKFLGKTTFRKDGISLDSHWNEFIDEYPNIFKEIPDSEEGVKLAEVLEQIYNPDFYLIKNEGTVEENAKLLANDIREATWDITDNLTMAEKYEETIAELREKIKTAEKRVEEESERKRLIQKIVEREDKLGRMLRKNDKENHIPDILKEPLKEMIKLVNVENYAPTTDMANNFTALAKALENVSTQSDAIENLTNYFDSTGYFIESVNEIAEELQKKIDAAKADIRPETSVKDLSIQSLRKLNEALAAITTAARNYDKILSSDTKARISQRAQSSMFYLRNITPQESKGDFAKIATTFFAWDNLTPIYGYDRWGQGGKETFEGIMNGDDTLTKNTETIINFAKETFKGEEVEKWENEIQDVNIDGKNYKITTTQLMSLYCLSKRENAKQHLYKYKNVYNEEIIGQGIVIGVISKVSEKTVPIKVDQGQVERLTSLLTDRQKEVADKLQLFMSTTCSDWGNYVTMRRFGILQFGEDNYFPMTVFRENSPSMPGEIPQQASIFKLLNMGFTKSLNERGNGALELTSIFDVFVTHSSEMAAYNAFALPILDTYKWLSYKEVITEGEGEEQKKKVESFKTLTRLAYGADGMNFIINHLEDLNGKSKPTTSAEKIFKTLTRNFKTAATAANIRVTLMQPISYLRAMNVLDFKYLKQALTIKPSEIKQAISEMNEKSLLAKKKNGLGAYDVNVSKTITEQILQTEEQGNLKGKVQKLMSLSMLGAQKADEITWAILYRACKLETMDKYPDEDIDTTTSERFREVCYRTQVFDSINARSNLMRKKDPWLQIITAFGSEPTLSYSMLSNEIFMYAVDARNSQNRAWAMHSANIKRAFTAYLMTAVLTSAVAALPDWLRDDEEDESFLQTYFKNCGLNILGEITGLLPYIRDISSIMIEGYDPSRPDEEIFVSARRAYKAIVNSVEEGKITYKAIYQSAKLFSQATGLPIGNIIRDIKSLWNKTIGKMFNMKIK